MRFRVFTSICLLSALLSSPAGARWATEDDMDYRIDNEELTYTVNPDGTYQLVVARTLEVLKESAKSAIGTQAIVYSGSSAEVKVLEAETVNGTNKTPVPKNMIEDKSVASTQLGFDDHKQTMIVFPDVKVGSKISYKYQMNVKKVPVSGFFSERFFPGTETFTKASTIRVESALPLYVKTRDPKHQLVIANGANGGKHVMVMRLKEPMIWRPIGEERPMLSPDEVPRVEVSTALAWSDIEPKLREGFETVIKGKLPASFEKIATEAKAKPSVEEKAQLVMARLAESLNYLGDWRSVGGKFAPREFAAVEASKHADCKDLSAATVAILRSIGVHADVALVFRGHPQDSSWAFRLLTQAQLPMLGMFNHAIVRIKDGAKSRWIDPTNSTAYAKGLRDDVADRPALVLAEGVKDLEQTERLKPESDVILVEKDIHFGERLVLEASGSVTFKGRAASDLVSMSLAYNHNKTNVEQVMLKFIASESLVRWWALDVSSLKTRLVNDFRIPFKYGADGASFLTSAGPAYSLEAVEQVKNLLVLPDRVTDLYVGAPSVLERVYRFHDIEMIGSQTVECYVKSRWIDAIRNAVRKPRGLEVHERLAFKEAVIPKSDLATPEFAKVQSELNRCFGTTAIVFRQKEKIDGRKLASVDGLVTKKTAQRWIEDWAYDSKPILKAKEFFETETAEKPESIEGYMWLSRAVFLLGHVKNEEFSRDHTEQALAVLEKGLALKPDHPELLALKGYYLAQNGDGEKAYEAAKSAFDKNPKSSLVQWAFAHAKLAKKDSNGAVSAFRKAIELGKNDGVAQNAHYDLGRLLLRELDWRPAEQHLQGALKLSSLNARYLLGLADLYMKQGELAKAEPLLKKAADVKDNPTIRAYLASVLLGQASGYMKAKYTHDKAEAYIKKGLTYRPDSHEAYYMLARIREVQARENRDMGAWRKALEYYERAATLNPEFKDAVTKARDVRNYLVDIGEIDPKTASRAPASLVGASAPQIGKEALPIQPDLNAGADPAPAPVLPEPVATPKEEVAAETNPGVSKLPEGVVIQGNLPPVLIPPTADKPKSE